MFKLFKRKKKRIETDQEMRERILSLCKDGDYGLCSPPMNAQVALNELKDFFLGEDWYSVMPVCQEQINTEIVYEIESKYRKSRKIYKK